MATVTPSGPSALMVTFPPGGSGSAPNATDAPVANPYVQVNQKVNVAIVPLLAIIAILVAMTDAAEYLRQHAAPVCLNVSSGLSDLLKHARSLARRASCYAVLLEHNEALQNSRAGIFQENAQLLSQEVLDGVDVWYGLTMNDHVEYEGSLSSGLGPSLPHKRHHLKSSNGKGPSGGAAVTSSQDDDEITHTPSAPIQ